MVILYTLSFLREHSPNSRIHDYCLDLCCHRKETQEKPYADFPYAFVFLWLSLLALRRLFNVTDFSVHPFPYMANTDNSQILKFIQEVNIFVWMVIGIANNLQQNWLTIQVTWLCLSSDWIIPQTNQHIHISQFFDSQFERIFNLMCLALLFWINASFKKTE